MRLLCFVCVFQACFELLPLLPFFILFFLCLCRHAISLGYLDDWMTLTGMSEADRNFVADSGSSAEEMQAHVAAYNANMQALGPAVLEAGGFWWNPRHIGYGPQIRPRLEVDGCYHDCAPKGLTPLQCSHILRTDWCTPDPPSWNKVHEYLIRPVPANATAAVQATAQFLLTRGPFAWTGFFDWQANGGPWPRPSVWDVGYGTPLGPCAETAANSGIFKRKWSSGAEVSWDCTQATGAITMPKE